MSNNYNYSNNNYNGNNGNRAGGRPNQQRVYRSPNQADGRRPQGQAPNQRTNRSPGPQRPVNNYGGNYNYNANNKAASKNANFKNNQKPAGNRGKMPKKLSTAGKVARVVFTSSIVLLITLNVLFGSVYVLADSLFLSKINYSGPGEDVIPSDLDKVVLDDEGDDYDPNAETLTEQQIADLEHMIESGLVDEANLFSRKGVENILLLGTDNRSKSSKGCRTDAMILLSINSNTKQLVMTSIMRDICVSIPGRSNVDKINAAHAYGGPALAVKTVEANFGIKVDKYATVDFYSFMDVVDALGGITLDITSAEQKVMNDYIHEMNGLLGQSYEKDVLYKTGSVKLNGKQTLAYVRNRYTGNGDFSRTEKQRRVLGKIFEGLKGSDLSTMLNVADVVASNITTSYSKSEIISKASNALEYLDYDLIQSSLPIDNSWKYGNVRGMSTIQIEIDKNRRALLKSIYGIE